MCRSHADGGRRCPESEASRRKHNEQRRHVYHAAKDESQMRAVLAEAGEFWSGNVQLDLSHPMVHHAYTIAVVAHQGVRRTTGDPYIDHPLHVATQLQNQGFKPEVVAIGLLHDVVEDTPTTLKDLRKKGFSEFVVNGVGGVTKDASLSKLDNVRRAASVHGSQPVKLADNLHNSAEDQLLIFAREVQERKRSQYREGRQILLPALFTDSIRSLMVNDQVHREYVLNLRNLLS